MRWRSFGADDRKQRDQNKHVFRDSFVSNTERDALLNLTQAPNLPVGRPTAFPHSPQRQAKAQSWNTLSRNMEVGFDSHPNWKVISTLGF